MTEIPKGPPKGEIHSGDQGPGLQCKSCGYGIAIGGNPSTLPASFEATCPTCGKKETYRSDEIQLLTAILKH
jgi:predicted RNA-binding Zn-ribbon protein involved in translation (DUF1610 family)